MITFYLISGSLGYFRPNKKNLHEKKANMFTLQGSPPKFPETENS